MKKYADKNRTFWEFKQGDMVFLKLQPYIQASVAPRANHKLMFKYYGPFPVLARVSETSYKLALPEGSTVHPIFHVSLLRQALADGMTATHTLPVDSDNLAIPYKILAKRWRKKANRTVEQVQVQWSTGNAASATWEDREELQSRFPKAPAWGQAGSEDRGGVRVPDDQGQTMQKNVGLHQDRRPVRAQRPNPKYHDPVYKYDGVRRG